MNMKEAIKIGAGFCIGIYLGSLLNGAIEGILKGANTILSEELKNKEKGGEEES